MEWGDDVTRGGLSPTRQLKLWNQGSKSMVEREKEREPNPCIPPHLKYCTISQGQSLEVERVLKRMNHNQFFLDLKVSVIHDTYF